jgi:hypothetical protein
VLLVVLGDDAAAYNLVITAIGSDLDTLVSCFCHMDEEIFKDQGSPDPSRLLHVGVCQAKGRVLLLWLLDEAIRHDRLLTHQSFIPR